MTCTVEITLHALSQRSPAESIGKGQKLIEAARPEGAEALKLTLKFIKLLPLQGALLTVTIPRAQPWAKSFWAFSPYLSHMRKFNQEPTLKSQFYKKSTIDYQ